MGNDLVKNYDLQKEPIGLGGLQSTWKIYSGETKDKAKQQVSVFLLEKKFLDKSSKVQREESMNLLRKQAQTLAKFRHPSILSIVEPLMEDGKSMAFVTERIAGCLSNYFSRNELKDVYGSELELKMHIIELLEALNFLHNDAKTASMGISPENIFKTMDGRWKLGGFVFSTQLINTDSGTTLNVDFSTSDSPLKSYPNLNYSAPEVVNIPSKCFYNSDIFSLGCLIISILDSNNKGRAGDRFSFINYSSFKDGIIRSLSEIPYQSFIPLNLKPLLEKILNADPSFRPSAHEVSSSNWLNDPFLQTIKYLDSLSEKDISQQQIFLKGLQNIILQFEDRVLKTRILPSLLKYVCYDQLSGSIVSCFFLLMEKEGKISNEEFKSMLWPGFKALSERKEMPAQSLFLIVSNLQLMLNYLTAEELQTSIMPLVLKCFECKVPKLQELVLKEAEFLMSKLDFVYIKSKVLPRILNLCCSENMEIRRSSLYTLYKVYNSFDRTTLNDQILQTLEKMKKMGTDTKMNILILAIYEGIAKIAGSETIGTKVLPNLCTYLIDQSVSKSEFKAFYNTILSLMKKIEEERMLGFAAIPGVEDITLEKIITEQEVKRGRIKKETKAVTPQSQNDKIPDFDFLSTMNGTSSTQNTQPLPFSNNINFSENKNTPFDPFSSETFAHKDPTPANSKANFEENNFFDINPQNKTSIPAEKPGSLNLKKPPPSNPVQNNNAFDFIGGFGNPPPQQNKHDIFNSMNMKPSGSTPKPSLAKGNITKLSYDPFAEIDKPNPIMGGNDILGGQGNQNNDGWNLQNLDLGTSNNPFDFSNSIPKKKNGSVHLSDLI